VRVLVGFRASWHRLWLDTAVRAGLRSPWRVSPAMNKVRRAAALGAVFGLGASLALAGPVLAQTSPSPDPDPSVRPDPIPSTTAKTTPTRQPTAPAPISQATPAAGTRTPPAQQAPAVDVVAAPAQPRRTIAARKARPSRRSRPASHHPPVAHPAVSPAAFERLISLDVAQRLLRPSVGSRPDDRRKAEALALAAIALLLVVVAEGSLLRLATRAPRRGRWA
jgi:hypothetical protein